MHALNFLWSLRHIWCVLDSGKAIDPCFFLLKHQYLYNPDKDRPLSWCLCMGLSLSCCEIPSWMSPTAPGSWGVCFAAVSGCLSPGSVLWVIPGSCGSSPAPLMGSLPMALVILCMLLLFGHGYFCRGRYSSSQPCCRIWSLCTSWILPPSHLNMPSKSCSKSTALRSRVPGQHRAMALSGLSYCIELN